MDYKAEILKIYEVGEYVLPSLKIKIVGRKYITCVSNFERVTIEKYTFKEFYFNFCNHE